MMELQSDSLLVGFAFGIAIMLVLFVISKQMEIGPEVETDTEEYY